MTRQPTSPILTYRRRVSSGAFAKCLYALSFALPWVLQRTWLRLIFGYYIHPTSRIGYLWIMPDRLIMGPESTIGHLTVCKNVDLLELDNCAAIGKGNWITGTRDSRYFQRYTHRCGQLLMGSHSAITHRHHLDCTDSISIGPYTTVAGSHSELWTHGIDVERSEQSARPITIGAYVLVGTRSILLGGAVVPSKSIIAAGSVVTGSLAESFCVYAGVPARPVRKIRENSKYFERTVGHVW